MESVKNDQVGLKIRLKSPEDFLVVKETLTRIGVPHPKEPKLYQTAHILHKRGEYFVCHFKEMFILDGRPSTITEDDLQRRNRIVKLLCDWKIIECDELSGKQLSSMESIRIIRFPDRGNYELIPKYTIGKRRSNNV